MTVTTDSPIFYPRLDELNSFWSTELTTERIDHLCCVGVADAAAFLDEHVPGWHARITRPLEMGSVEDCVLGQVFDPDRYREGPRRFFGLFPPKRRDYSFGYSAGLKFLSQRGFNDRPFVFSSDQAAPYWRAEISRRST